MDIWINTGLSCIAGPSRSLCVAVCLSHLPLGGNVSLSERELMKLYIYPWESPPHSTLSYPRRAHYRLNTFNYSTQLKTVFDLHM